MKTPKSIQENRIKEVAHELWPGCEVILKSNNEFISFRVQIPRPLGAEPFTIIPYSEDRSAEFWAGLDRDGVRERLIALGGPRA